MNFEVLNNSAAKKHQEEDNLMTPNSNLEDSVGSEGKTATQERHNKVQMKAMKDDLDDIDELYKELEELLVEKKT